MSSPLPPVGNPEALLQPFPGGWAVLLNLDTAGAVALNPTALLVWRLVDGRRTFAEIAAEIATRFRDAPLHLAEDVRGVLADLAEEGLVAGRCFETGLTH